MSDAIGTTYPDRATWLTARRAGIGASEAPALIGVSRWSSPLRLYAEKLGLAEPIDETEAMRWGTALEPIVADRYVEETKREVLAPPPFTIYHRPDRPWMLATPDRFVTKSARGVGGLEIKTTGFLKAEEWSEEPPLRVEVQAQQQMCVMGWTWVSIAVLIGGQRFLWCDVERNDPFIARLIECGEAFIDRLKRQDPPPADATAHDLLAKLYPTADGQSVPLPAAALAWDATRLEAQEQLKHWKAVQDEADALLKGAMGAATFGVLPDGTTYRWKASERKGYVVRATTVRTLRRLNP